MIVKLSEEKSNSKIGDIWVSWFLDGLTTIRDKDWEELSQHYFIPVPRNNIDHTTIRLRDGKRNCLEAKDNLSVRKRPRQIFLQKI